MALVIPTDTNAAICAPSDSPIVPEAWCRRLVTSLARRKVQDRAAGNLEMLLAFLIEVNPPTDAFGTLLARHADSGRAEIAEAAGVLQRAWHEGHDTAGGLLLPPLQETLRTLGARIDDTGVRAAYLTLSPDNAHLQPIGQPEQYSLDPVELRLEIAARTALRGKAEPANPHAPIRCEARLRAVGAGLDGEPTQGYELFVTPRTVVVEGSEGYYRTWTLEDVIAALPPGALGREVGRLASTEDRGHALTASKGEGRRQKRSRRS